MRYADSLPPERKNAADRKHGPLGLRAVRGIYGEEQGCGAATRRRRNARGDFYLQNHAQVFISEVVFPVSCPRALRAAPRPPVEATTEKCASLRHWSRGRGGRLPKGTPRQHRNRRDGKGEAPMDPEWGFPIDWARSSCRAGLPRPLLVFLVGSVGMPMYKQSAVGRQPFAATCKPVRSASVRGRMFPRRRSP